MKRKSLVMSALVLAVMTAATMAYAGSALQLYVGCGLDYIKHVNFNSGASAIGTPYQVPNTSTEFKSCEQPLRSGSYRALASTASRGMSSLPMPRR